MPSPIDTLPSLADRRPKAVCASLDLSAPARAHAADDPSPTHFLRALLQGRHHRDALHYLAHAMPRRAAVHWACGCVLAARGGALPPAARRALQAAMAWADAPGDAACSAAADAADEAAMEGEDAARFAALAAAWSGTSLAAEGQPVVPPPIAIGAAAAAAALLIAAAGNEDAQRDFISRGILAARAQAAMAAAAPPLPPSG